MGNDLENFYYLWVTGSTLEQLAEAFLRTVEVNLPDLYLGAQDEERGIYGDPKKMFNFHKNNIEAFPVFAIPRAYVDRLGRLARENLLAEIEAGAFTRNPTVITANMSFFLSREGDENQSPYLLLARAFSRDRLVSEDELREAFHLAGTYSGTAVEIEKKLKADIKTSLEKQKYHPGKVKRLFREIVRAHHQRAGEDPEGWSVVYSRKKALPLSPREVVAALAEEARLGFYSFAGAGGFPESARGGFPEEAAEKQQTSRNTCCRSCGSGRAALVDNHIIMGEDVGKFHNQTIRQGSALEKICVRCCVEAYLVNKLVGNVPGSLAFVPQQASVIFHYGRHKDEEIKAIAAVLKDVFSLVRERRNLASEMGRLHKEKKELEARLAAAKGAKTKENYASQLAGKDKEIQEREASYQECSRDLLAVLNRLKTSGGLPGSGLTLGEPALEIIADAGIFLDSAEHYIFGIGLGEYRLMAFILPQIRHRLEKKAHDYVQQRFNNSRVTVLTVLAFLRKICGCAGPWYYLTLPALTTEGFSTDAFYVRGQKYSAAQVYAYYENFTGFANEVVRGGPDVLERKILLTERLLTEPLVVLAEVLRKSGALARQDEPVYSVIYDPVARKPALEKYLGYFKQFQNYQKLNRRDLS